ncbi:MAG: ATP-binding protein [Desulfobacteraceae bacterium]|nr:ATP-binding protein [Desulfobacteraceae bacterium]
MTNSINWGLIQSGATFEALVRALVRFEYPDADLFGRPGKDGGQDVRSGDKTTVFQAKFHKSATPAKSIKDALDELKKIKKYKTQGHENEKLWQDVKKWILVTNVLFNPKDQERWENEVIPVFVQSCLDAEVWGCEILETLLIKHPEIRRSFFENKNRSFLSLGEAYERLHEEDISERGLETEIHGRTREFKLAENFLSSEKKVMLIHGPGGVGKSRLLFGIGHRATTHSWQVLWANVETLATGDWYEAVIPEQKTLILVDEPTMPKVINMILEQISVSTNRSGKWKTIIAIRTPKDPVLSVLRNPKLKYLAEVPLKPLYETDANSMALDLLKKGTFEKKQSSEHSEKVAQHIGKRFHGFPVWIAVAVNELEKKGNLTILPQHIEDLAKYYFDEMLDFQVDSITSKEEIINLIRWTALYRVINIENNELMNSLEKLPHIPKKSKICRCLKSLSEKRFLISRGINKRLYEIKPDVMRDYVLREWLTIPADDNSRRLSGEAGEVIDLILQGNNGKELYHAGKIIQSLARAELVERTEGSPVQFLDPVIDRLYDLSLNGSTTDQRNVVNFLSDLSFARVIDTVEILKVLRTEKKPPEQENVPLWGVQTISHDDIIKKLAWELYLISKYAVEPNERKEILDEMCQLVLEEAELSERNSEKLPNDGKRAEALLSRIITGEPDFSTGYTQEAFNEGKFQIEKMCSKKRLKAGSINLIKAVLQPQLSVERMDISSDGYYSINFRRYNISLKGDLGIKRGKLTEKLRDIIAADVIESNRIPAWDMLSEAHSNANRARITGRKAYDELDDDLIGDLEWTLEEIKNRELSIKELKAAREIWEWHYKYESMPELKNLAEQCEKIYKLHPMSYDFHDLFDYDDLKLAEQKAVQIGRKLSGAYKPSDIFGFIKDAMEFADDQEKIDQLYPAAYEIGKNIIKNQVINDFVFEALKYKPCASEFKFAAMVVNIWLKTIRENETDSLNQILTEIIKVPSSEFDKQQLLFHLYAYPHPSTVGILKKEDLSFIESQLFIFSDANSKWKLFRILGCMFFIDWKRFTLLFEESWEKVGPELKTECFFHLFNGIRYIDLFRKQLPVNITPDQFKWILTQILLIPDIDEISRLEWIVQELLKRVGRLPLSWLTEALQQRIILSVQFEKANKIRYKIVPNQFNLSEFVCPADAESIKETSVINSIKKLLGFNDQQNSVGYALPEYTVQVDPDGLLVPSLVVDKLSDIEDKINSEQIWLWSRYAGYYPKDSESWRTIAVAACKLSNKLRERERIRIYSSLESQKVKVRSRPVGEMDPWYENELQNVRLELENEKDQELLKYRQWKLKVAEAEYEHAFEVFKENQGNEFAFA